MNQEYWEKARAFHGHECLALPTSVGYGASFGGLAALLGMLNSCAPGVSVVNIDNGFGAGYLANMINQRN
jgi:NCAIR mutase (PurE)-related protein